MDKDPVEFGIEQLAVDRVHVVLVVFIALLTLGVVSLNLALVA